MTKKKGKKKVNFVLIDRVRKGQPESSVPYILLDDVVARHHKHLDEANIAIAWRKNWAADRDGLLVLGKMKKASDLDRQLVEYDAVMLLNEEAWEELNEKQRRALIDHECCHLQIVEDDKAQDGKKRDENGRVCYRIRKHDLEEFREIVQRHGCYKSDIEDFVTAALKQGKPGIFKAFANG